MATTRREFLKVAGGAAAAGAAGFPAMARAQAKLGVPSDPVKIGILAIRAGSRSAARHLEEIASRRRHGVLPRP